MYSIGAPGGIVVVSPGWVVGGAVTGGNVANAVVEGTIGGRVDVPAESAVHAASAPSASAPKAMVRTGWGTPPAYADRPVRRRSTACGRRRSPMPGKRKTRVA